MAQALLDQGARVVITGRDPERARAVADELHSSRDRLVGLGLDVASRESFSALVDSVVHHWGRIDILVNNAGETASTPFAELQDEEWDRVLAVNLRSVFIGCQLVAPLMFERGWGRIINHASIAGQQGGAVTGPHYAASKAGILVLTKIVATELASSGVTVNAIAPAAIDGAQMQAMPAERIEGLAKKIPVGRVGHPEEVGALVVFLASDEAGFITGATVDINGGLFMR